MQTSTKIGSVAAAVAAALGSVVWMAPAHALAPNVAITARVYVGGATAQDNGVERVARTVCQNNVAANGGPNQNPNTRMDIYRGTDNRVFTCLANSALAPAVANGTAIAIAKTSVGGSGTGVIPIARNATTYTSGGTTINVVFLSDTLTTLPNSGNCTVSGGPLNDGVVPSETTLGSTFAGYVNHTACGVGTNVRVPQIGVSDVEPDKTADVAPEEPGRLTTVAVNHGVFGIVVSQNLRNALQAAQNLTVGSETYANMPSLTRRQIGSIFTGGISNWNEISSRAGVGLVDMANADPAIPNPLNGTTFIMRRVPSSGTQAITEIFTTGARCMQGVAEFLPDSDPAGNGSGVIPTFNTTNYVQEYSSSTGVRNGMDRAAGALSVQNPAAPERWAIGLLSTENNNIDTANGNRAYRFIKIDGFAPTLLDTVNSGYAFYAEQVANISNGAAGAAPPPPAGLPTAFHSYLVANLSAPAVLDGLNAAFRYPWGDAGLLGIPDPNNSIFAAPEPRTQATVRATPINSSFKSGSGATNNCQYPTILGFGAATPAGGVNNATSGQSNP